jgi:hypothetical protein
VCVCLCVFVCVSVCRLETSTSRPPLVRVGLLHHRRGEGGGGEEKKSKVPRKLFVAVN